MDIFEFMKHGNLSSIGMQYEICPECSAVAYDLYAPIAGIECRSCGKPIHSHRWFFQDLLLLDLIREAYNSIPESGDANQAYPHDAERTHAAAVIVLFCTLKELLLLRFMYSLINAKELADPIQERLVADNNTHEKRRRKLFPSLVGVSWDDALLAVETEEPAEFSSLDKFLEEITNVRNEFVHKGIFAHLDVLNAKQCVLFLVPLLELYVRLNNRYVHPIRLDAIRKKNLS